LEFKGRDKLSDREELAASAVAFLNSHGGDLYIGVREEGGRAVAIEGIDDSGSEAQKLHNSLLDRIEPSPGPDEIRIEVLGEDPGGSILRIRVKRGAHRPYAVPISKGAEKYRRYDLRVGKRRRPMTREELAAAFSGTGETELPGAKARQILVADRQEVQSDEKDWFWVGIQPARDVALDVQRPDLSGLLTDREAIGVLAGAPSFHVSFEPELKQGRLVYYAIPGHELIKETEIRNDGGIRFRTVISHLYRHATGSSPRWINPDVLIGIPRSLLALVKPVLGESLADEDLVLIDLAVLGLGDEEAKLLPGRWRRPRPGQEARSMEPGEDFVLSRPLQLTLREIEEEPERCVVRLLRELYEAFGLREEAIPVSGHRPSAFDA
jgi:hypothetical protein